MNWKVCSILVLLTLLLPVPVSVAEETSLIPAAQPEEYRRPADIPFPAENPYTLAKAELGRTLFFDPIFSRSRSLSCASCHDPGLSWGDGRARARGEGHSDLALRSPTLLNVAWTLRFGWDGKFRNLEAVTFAPITAAMNMNLPEAELIERLTKIPQYVQAFSDVFGDGITRRNIERALATYERTIISGEAPFDRWIMGDDGAIEPAAKRGFDLFKSKGRCAECHSGWAFTDGSFHDIGTAQRDDIGRGRLFPTSEKLRYAFKTPTLRDAVRRAPYMHDGSLATLTAVIDLYDQGGISRPSRSELIRPLGLTPGEKADLVAFLNTLTGTPQPIPAPNPTR